MNLLVKLPNRKEYLADVTHAIPLVNNGLTVVFANGSTLSYVERVEGYQALMYDKYACNFGKFYRYWMEDDWDGIHPDVRN